MQVPVDEPAPCPSRLHSIRGTASVVSADPFLDARAVEKLGRIVHERCPIANMVSASGCTLDIQWVVVEPTTDDWDEMEELKSV